MEVPLTVSQLNTKVRALLSSSPGLRDIWVSGEISGLKRASSGHYYFVLKDATGAVNCALFARARSRVEFEPRDSMKVQAFGSVDLYVQRGSYQFIVENMRQSGTGELYQAFEELKRRLQAEGLFEASRKRPLPKYPRTIGVVTSETGAVIHDIITTSASRFPADILLAPAQVQGDGAAETIVAGIRLLEKVGVDVMIVGRGGGSIEDLWPFNEEIVARAISECTIPVVSAVGHETDFTIADFVADVRAPTPTGAAAIILRDRSEIRDQLNRDMANAGRALSAVLDRMSARFGVLDAKLSPERAVRDLEMRGMSVDDLSSRMVNALNGKIRDMEHRLALASARISVQGAAQDMDRRRKAVDDLFARAERAANERLSSANGRLAVAGARLSPAAASQRLASARSEVESAFARAQALSSAVIGGCEAKLDTASAKLGSLSPTRVMERGYGIILRPNGQVLTSVSDMLVGEKVDIRLRDGTARASVREIMEDKE